MKTRHIKRRNTATATRIASMVLSGERRMGIMDPAFNLREVAKQMILVEDHLYHPHKYCPDCVRKHLLTIEALAEEAVTLGTTDLWTRISENIAELARNWLMRIFDKSWNPCQVADQIRVARKELVPFVFDPRNTELRVASFYEALQQECPHR